MSMLLLPLFPLLAGGAIATGGRRWPGRVSSVAATATVIATLALAMLFAATGGVVRFDWGGALAPTLAMTPRVAVAAVLVPSVATPVIAWAAAHEAPPGRHRLLGLLAAFVGAMELLVLAADWLTLAFAWELVGALSWALIAHRHRQAEHVADASYAFNATRLGGVGLWVAASASLAATGDLAFEAAPQVATGPGGTALAAGVLAAAAAKSAQGPFAPWLFRAMSGPSSVSALLHSSTMVAAGTWLLIRLGPALSSVTWFGPATLGLGLATAIAGSVVAARQSHIKRLLAASTSAQYGFMWVAVGAGYPTVALLHLVTHALFKALLFLVAGIALEAAGTSRLQSMGLSTPRLAAVGAVGTLALAGVPPLGAAWSKEQIVAAAGHLSPAIALFVIGAGGLSAWYAARLHRLAFRRSGPTPERSTSGLELGAMGALALGCILLSFAWLPAGHRAIAQALPGELPSGAAWELAASVGVVLLAIVASWVFHGRARDRPGGAAANESSDGVVAAWLGLPTLIRALVIQPTVALAVLCARADAFIVDGGVRGATAVVRGLSRWWTRWLESGIEGVVAAISKSTLRSASASRALDDAGVDGLVNAGGAWIGHAGRACRRTQSGAVPTYYTMVTVGLLGLALALVLGA